MKKLAPVKGFIEIVVVFIIAISFAIAAIITLFWSKAPRTASHLKRLQAINYAEAALYESFNRFRTGYNNWDQWLPPTNSAPADPTITVDGVTVTISIEVNDMLTPADLTDDMTKVMATLDQDDIELEL
ncbi:MAG: hypothetical protein RAP41_05680 [Candidatus Orphnella occulta]|nr:hypothetical protein [Candidatus Orphnella occulta]